MAIHETAAAINSTIADAYIGFSTMTCPLVAVVTDVVREGKPVVGFGFSSNGSCAAGAIMRERMMPRLLGVPPDTLLGPATGLTDPFRARDAMMTNQKPGGHIERSVAVGTLDKAIWRQGDLATRRSGDKAIWHAVAKVEGCRSGGSSLTATGTAGLIPTSGSTPPAATTGPGLADPMPTAAAIGPAKGLPDAGAWGRALAR